MMACCNKENMDLKHLRSSLNDPTSALILVQGHWTLHLAMFLASLYASKGRVVLQCFQTDASKTDPWYDYNVDGSILNYSLEHIRWTHFACFICLFG